MKLKKIQSIIRGLILSICLIVICYCSYIMFTTLYSDYQSDKEINLIVDDFKNQLNSNEIENDVDEFGNEIITEIEGATVGVIVIERLDIEAPMAYTEIYDANKTKKTIKTHVGIYTEYGDIGVSGTNTVLAAHSCSLTNGCGFTPFTDLELVQEGDNISILWNDNYLYTYEVFLATRDQDPYSEWFYDQPINNNQEITLITCTRKNTKFRTVVRAKLVEVKYYNN